MPDKAIILFAHGARDPQWAEPFVALKARVAAQSGCPVELAFLELMQPDLASCVASLMAQSISDIRIVPCFMARGAHLRRDLPALVDALRQQHPAMRFELTDALGEAPAVQDAMAAWIIEAA